MTVSLSLSLVRFGLVSRFTNFYLFLIVSVNVIATKCFFFVTQKTAYEVVSGDWSSDVCSSDLACSRRPYSRESPAWLASVSNSRRSSPVNDEEARSEERRVGKECLTQCRSR